MYIYVCVIYKISFSNVIGIIVIYILDKHDKRPNILAVKYISRPVTIHCYIFTNLFVLLLMIWDYVLEFYSCWQLTKSQATQMVKWPKP